MNCVVRRICNLDLFEIRKISYNNLFMLCSVFNGTMIFVGGELLIYMGSIFCSLDTLVFFWIIVGYEFVFRVIYIFVIIINMSIFVSLYTISLFLLI